MNLRLPSALAGPALIDAHAHLHSCFELDTFFQHAAANFGRAADELNAAPYFSGVIALTESRGADRFGQLQEVAAGRPRGDLAGWELHDIGEPTSLVAVRGNRRLLLVAGRQIRTRERLEVLAIGTVASFADGQRLVETVRDVLRSGALAVLPWGFGKWWFGRCRLVIDALEASHSTGLFLGDNGGRPGLMRRPRLLERAESMGIPILSGSDPLPFPREVTRVGRFGSVLRSDLDGGRPAGSLLDGLKEARSTLMGFGSPASLGSFLEAQVRIRVRSLRNGTDG